MAPPLVVPRSDLGSSTKDPLDYSRHDAIVEGWAQGFNVGAIVVLILILLCNYRPRVLLHKLIVVEVNPPFDLPKILGSLTLKCFGSCYLRYVMASSSSLAHQPWDGKSMFPSLAPKQASF